MDKLKPILAQKFWILSGLCLLLPLVGWWLDTAAMSKELTDRTNTIKSAFTNIPKPGPNAQWTDQVLAKNKDEEAKVIRVGDQLWQDRLALHVWPESVRAVVEATTFRGPIDPTTRAEYRDAYELELVRIHKIVSPFNDWNSTGLVLFPIETLPSEHLGALPTHPSDVVTWDAQEDIWLYQTLLEAVARTNAHGDAKTILDAAIKEITMIELRGGSPKVAGAAPGGPTAGPAGGPMGPMGPPGAPPSMGAPPGGSPFGGGGQGSDTLTASFDPTEVFGSDADTSGGAGAGAAGPMGSPGAPPKPPGGGPMVPMGPMGFNPGGDSNSNARKRYIEEEKRYKTRGFYLEVVIDHRHVPEFLAELSDSPWPLRVVRVQQVDRDLSDIGSTVVGASAGASMGPQGGSSASRGIGMPSSAGGKGPGAVRRPSRGGAADEEDGGMRNRFSGRPAAGGVNVQGGEGLLDPAVALADPNLVTLAVAGIITLYLPPEPVAATPGAPGAPAPTTENPTATTPQTTGLPAPMTQGIAPMADAAGTTAAPVAAGNPGTPDTTNSGAGAPAGGAPVPGEVPSNGVPNSGLKAGDTAAEPAAGAVPTPPATPPEGAPVGTPGTSAPSAEQPAAPVEKQ